MKSFSQFLVVAVSGLIGCAAAPSLSEKDPSTLAANREVIIDSMKSEMERSMNLKLRDYKSPYFIAYAVEDRNDYLLSARYGSLVGNDHSRSRSAYVEVRVGEYAFDNFASVDGESFRLSDYQADRTAPLDANPDALRGALWLITDEVYKKAVSDYLTKLGTSVYETDEKKDVPTFSKEKASRHRDKLLTLEFDEAGWTKIVKEITTDLRSNSNILDSSMEVSANHVVRYFVNSEGSDVITERTIYTVNMSAWARAEDGMLLDHGRTFYVRDAEFLPSVDTLRSEAKTMVEELLALRTAPVMDPYAGPAILEPEASGVLFHEVIGHRLEGERQHDEEEGRTFNGRVGKNVIPDFLSVRDDPTPAEFGGKQLNGHYRFDAEGVVAQNAILIQDGTLRGFLKSRTPVKESLMSNGHGRAQGIHKPMARMSTLIVEARAQETMKWDDLKKELMEETKRQGKPYGLIIRDITGGSTNTSGWGYQAFKGSPRLIYQVDPNTGKETLVRGVELVGTPLTSINKIIAAGDTPGVFNGYCGAESGYVPVSTIAPSLLTTEIELQRKPQANQRSPILPPPWK